MKNFRLIGFDIRFFFSVRRVKRLVFDLPDWADDTMIDTEGAQPRIVYYKGFTPFYIDLPGREAVKVSLSPMYLINGNTRARNTNRKIVVDVFK